MVGNTRDKDTWEDASLTWYWEGSWCKTCKKKYAESWMQRIYVSAQNSRIMKLGQHKAHKTTVAVAALNECCNIHTPVLVVHCHSGFNLTDWFGLHCLLFCSYWYKSTTHKIWASQLNIQELHNSPMFFPMSASTLWCGLCLPLLLMGWPSDSFGECCVLSHSEDRMLFFIQCCSLN